MTFGHLTIYFSNRFLAKPKYLCLERKAYSVFPGQLGSIFFSMRMSQFFSFGKSEILLQFKNPLVTIENKMSGCWLIILEEKNCPFSIIFSGRFLVESVTSAGTFLCLLFCDQEEVHSYICHHRQTPNILKSMSVLQGKEYIYPFYPGCQGPIISHALSQFLPQFNQ